MCYTTPSLLYSFERSWSSILAYFDGYKAKKAAHRSIQTPAGGCVLILVLSAHSSWQVRLLLADARRNTARSGERQTACGQSQRSGRPARHRRSACTGWDTLPRTVSACV